MRPSRQLGQEKDGRAAAYPGHDHGDVAHEKGQPRRVALLAILTANGARPPLRPHPECRGTEASGQIDRLRTGLLADLERIDPGAATGIWADLAWDIDMGDYPSEEAR